ncbi:hypothetical protein Acr_00g0019760 [Actinidia rufa]|uniref:Uncharacterized protein n=1 Tax=Actinidia rufa TaxID=165716 RepID=A0A7J0DBU4_9ERIC|nr:hypothetical protein Acr_00g0019760 [Actinidia rufa]
MSEPHETRVLTGKPILNDKPVSPLSQLRSHAVNLDPSDDENPPTAIDVPSSSTAPPTAANPAATSTSNIVNAIAALLMHMNVIHTDLV